MGDALRDVPIENLELSERARELLKALEVTTVGQLLDLPKIETPKDWPAKIAALVARELVEVLAELGVEYGGKLIAPKAKAATSKVTGSVAARWKTISAWLQGEQPKALAQFNPPATKEAIEVVEKSLGVDLPADYKQFLAIHNGQHEFAPMVGFGALLPIEEVVKAKQRIADTDPTSDEIDADQVGEGVRAVEHSEGWIPISVSARGRDYLCLDLDPAQGGTHGQIIEYIVDGNARPLVAKSFADLLSVYFEQAQSGEINFERDDDDA